MTHRSFTLKDWATPEDEARYHRQAQRRPFANGDLGAAGLTFVSLPAVGTAPHLPDGEREVARETVRSEEEIALARDWAARRE